MHNTQHLEEKKVCIALFRQRVWLKDAILEALGLCATLDDCVGVIGSRTYLLRDSCLHSE
jgi:hypothetical protein